MKIKKSLLTPELRGMSAAGDSKTLRFIGKFRYPSVIDERKFPFPRIAGRLFIRFRNALDSENDFFPDCPADCRREGTRSQLERRVAL